MSQIPPPDPAAGAPNYPPAPGLYAVPPQSSGGVWKWIAGLLALLLVTPCICCGGCLAIGSMFKDVTISNGEHLGGSPMNVRFHYKFNDQRHGSIPPHYIVVRSASGVRREQEFRGFGFSIPAESDWSVSPNVDLGPKNNKQPVQVWIEAENPGGGRSVVSNTLKIYPKQ